MVVMRAIGVALKNVYDNSRQLVLSHLLFLRIHFGKIDVHNNVHKGVPDIPEDLFRIGEKLISTEKLHRIIEQILEQRSRGLSQQDVAGRFGVDRTFVSRLEGLGAVRKGSSLAVIGFPVKNKDEILALLTELGVDFSLIMTDDERWRFVQEKSGIELFNEIMSLVAKARTFDVVVVHRLQAADQVERRPARQGSGRLRPGGNADRRG